MTEVRFSHTSLRLTYAAHSVELKVYLINMESRCAREIIQIGNKLDGRPSGLRLGRVVLPSAPHASLSLNSCCTISPSTSWLKWLRIKIIKVKIDGGSLFAHRSDERLLLLTPSSLRFKRCRAKIGRGHFSHKGAGTQPRSARDRTGARRASEAQQSRASAEIFSINFHELTTNLFAMAGTGGISKSCELRSPKKPVYAGIF